jgi:hypothetical protein
MEQPDYVWLFHSVKMSSHGTAMRTLRLTNNTAQPSKNRRFETHLRISSLVQFHYLTNVMHHLNIVNISRRDGDCLL